MGARKLINNSFLPDEKSLGIQKCSFKWWLQPLFCFFSGKINQQQGIYCSHSVQRIGKTRQTKRNICFMSAKYSHMRIHAKPKNSYQDYSFRSFIWSLYELQAMWNQKKHKNKNRITHIHMSMCTYPSYRVYSVCIYHTIPQCEVCDSHLFLSFLSVNLKFD